MFGARTMANVTTASWLSRLGQYHPRLITAAVAMNENRLHDAEPLLRQHLKEDPFDVAAIRMMAELAGRIGRYKDSESLLRRALDISPAFTAARANLALVLYRLNRPAEAIAELDRVTAEEPDNPGHANLHAAALGRIGEFDEAIALYEKMLADLPHQPRVWMSFGHMLKTVGRQADGVAAYRRALELMPTLGEAWWSLANLKTVRFSDEDISAMRSAINSGGVAKDDRFHLDFALGKALEDRGAADEAFAHYAAGNALRRSEQGYDPGETTRLVDRLIAIATPEFFAERAGQGCDAPDPVFILGCRAPDRHWSSRSCPATVRSKALASCPICPCWRAATDPIRPVCSRIRQSICANWARNTSNAPASTARPTGLCISTSCPTIGRMSR